MSDADVDTGREGRGPRSGPLLPRPQALRSRLAGLAIVAVAGCLAPAGGAAAREPSVAPDQLLPAHFLGVVRLRDTDGGAVALRVGQGAAQRTVPIFIGPVEAAAIGRLQRGERPHRPLTHELLSDLFPATGLELRRVVIDDLRDGIFYATLEVAAGAATVWVDARPSDGIALALARGAPLFVGPRVAASEPGPGDPSAEETPAAQPVAQRLRVP